MDEMVHRALARWPNVPACHGWLGLDARGDWYLRDAAVQACGAFSSGRPGARGSRVEHAGLAAFIARNYEVDGSGCWFFQNGPQRVFVELAVTPWIWRVGPDGSIRAHTDRAASVLQALVDEQGRLFLHTDLGLGLVHTQDMVLAAGLIEQGLWRPRAVRSPTLAGRYGFVLSPQALRDGTR